ncbi:MAG: NF038132 family protein [Alphaproteobacteria bacterium]
MALIAALAGGVSSRSADAAVCFGNCGTLGADGVVTAPPGGTTYDYVSTWLGQGGRGQIAGVAGGTNGSELISDPFFARAGDTITFDFNYVTSDGSGFPDYAFASLLRQDGTVADYIFTARTQPAGTIVPGQGLPDVTATLTPASVEIIPGGPTWSPLGESSGSCYDAGCGYTDWVNSEYTVEADGTYQLRFGVANANDTAFDSGLAFSGLKLDGSPIGDGSSPEDPLLPVEIDPVTGAFNFVFTATPNQVVFVDPPVAVGYDFEVTSGPLIASAIFPVIPGSSGLYSVYELGTDTLLFGNVLPNVTIDFTTLPGYAGGIGGFTLEGIAPQAMLDPDNPTAFVTGLTFVGPGTVNLSQTPIVEDFTAVPEPASLTLLVAGLLGFAMVRRGKAGAA